MHSLDYLMNLLLMYNSFSPAAALCPENAYCVPDGPGLFQCLCTSGFHGYKCLREVKSGEMNQLGMRCGKWVWDLQSFGIKLHEEEAS